MGSMSTNKDLPEGVGPAAIAEAVADWQTGWTGEWHVSDQVKPATCRLADLIADQHRRNYLLWHEEDTARSPDASDTVIADVKRRIDKLNQERNDRIERIDEFLQRLLIESKIQIPEDAPWNTETPGNSIDRLSIMSLKVFHMREQEEREDASEEHRATCREKRLVLEIQRKDLTTALQQHLDDVFAGRKQVKLYRQFKMYNDPSLNPAIYKAEK